jgi:hypothetical protein
MTALATWWKPEAKPSGLSDFEVRGPHRGSFGGQCHQVTCMHSGSDWYNKNDDRYYCDSCAHALNDDCVQQGEPMVCTLHI